MTTTKAALALVKGDVIVPEGEMPLQVDAIAIAGQSVAVFYFDGRNDTSINASADSVFNVLVDNETWCYDHGIVTFTDKGKEADTGWCTLSCGCMYEDALEDDDDQGW